MPQLSDLVKKRTEKTFVKKAYRPWDLSGNGIAILPHSQSDEATQSSDQHNNQPIHAENEHNSNTHLDNNKGNTQATFGEHTDNIKETTKVTRGNTQVTNRKQKDNNLDNNKDNDKDNVTSTDLDNIQPLADAIRQLCGIQKRLFNHIVTLCSQNSLLETGIVFAIDLATVAKCSIGSMKTSLLRLEDKKLLIRKKGKLSKGGYMNFSITPDLKIAALQADHTLLMNLNRLDKDNNKDNNLDNNLDNMPYSSSSLYINNTTTALPPDWEKIEFSSLVHIGFSKTQLQQLYEKQLNTPEIIQESINHFAFGEQHNPKIKAYPDPLNVLMGVLRKGQMWIEKNYISPKEIALKELLEFKKQEALRIQTLEKNILDEEFKCWLKTLPSDEKAKILESAPKTNFISKELAERSNDGYLFTHFKNHIFKKIL